MKAFHGEQTIKNKHLTKVKNHRLAGQLVQNDCYEKSSVGCTLYSSHENYGSELGLIKQFAWVQYIIFERSSNVYSQLWTERFLEAISIGMNESEQRQKLSLFLACILEDLERLPRLKEVAMKVGALHRRAAIGDTPDDSEWAVASHVASFDIYDVYAATKIVDVYAGDVYNAAKGRYVADAINHAASYDDVDSYTARIEMFGDKFLEILSH